MLEVEIRGAVGYLTIVRPEVRNALGPEVVAKLAAGLDRIESEPSVRAVVLTGSGKVFSAGADLGSMRKQGAADAEDNRRNALEMGRLFHRIYDFPKPVVARVPGPAIGGGVGLMTACDVIVAVDSAFFSFSEVRLGIVPALISPFCIRRLGVAKATTSPRRPIWTPAWTACSMRSSTARPAHLLRQKASSARLRSSRRRMRSHLRRTSSQPYGRRTKRRRG
jgi:enoyl-CoA hydratase/carnithine racemase